MNLPQLGSYNVTHSSICPSAVMSSLFKMLYCNVRDLLWCFKVLTLFTQAPPSFTWAQNYEAPWGNALCYTSIKRHKRVPFYIVGYLLKSNNRIKTLKTKAMNMIQRKFLVLGIPNFNSEGCLWDWLFFNHKTYLYIKRFFRLKNLTMLQSFAMVII